jgi:hypothetical protein
VEFDCLLWMFLRLLGLDGVEVMGWGDWREDSCETKSSMSIKDEWDGV